MMASQAGTFGMVALEPQGCGRPVISASSGRLEDFIQQGNGFWVHSDNPVPPAGAMRQLIREYDRFDPTAIYMMAHRQFGEEAFVTKWKELTGALHPSGR